MDLMPELKRVEVEFHDGAQISCVGWVEQHAAELRGVDDTGGVVSDVDSFTIHVVDEGWAKQGSETQPLSPGEYLVTADGVYRDGQIFDGPSAN